MNRIIKFRAWDKKKSKFWYFNFEDIYQEAIMVEHDEFAAWSLEEMPKNEYIGLKDKNGKEIYEGDIIFEPLNNINGLVVYKDGAFGFEFNNKEQWVSFASWYDLQVTVTGNIYENLTLMESA